VTVWSGGTNRNNNINRIVVDTYALSLIEKYKEFGRFVNWHIRGRFLVSWNPIRKLAHIFPIRSQNGLLYKCPTDSTLNVNKHRLQFRTT